MSKQNQNPLRLGLSVLIGASMVIIAVMYPRETGQALAILWDLSVAIWERVAIR